MVYSQISPGDLTKAHANLEGISNCTKCHVLGEKVTNTKCLDCHTEIRKLINLNRGYHASAEVKNKECRSCHSEHNGRNFQIIRFDTDKFDHKKTGFELLGKHKEIQCRECHASKNIKEKKLKNRSSTFLGLERDCITCHADYHQNTLGNNCSSCHTFDSFRPAKLFNHDNAKFRLTGRHKEVLCEKCHIKEIKNSAGYQKFKGVNFSSCQSCHTDPHGGKFGNDCEKCHNTNSFKQVNVSQFDHNKTKFPLLGKHKNVNCNACHGNNLSNKPKFEHCTDCHKDYHDKQFVTDQGDIKDCSFCHTVSGFSPSRFTIKEHNKTNFKISGKHLAVSCFSCHYKNNEWRFKNIGVKCFNCHSNVHGTELTEKYLGNNNCESCHDVSAWSSVSFNHQITGFQLLGKHQKAECRDCHTISTEEGRKFRFISLDSKCENCHNDIHSGQFSMDNNNDCLRCHQFENWEPVNFDHNKTRFSLAGAHAKIPCNACHKLSEKNGNSFVNYKLSDFRCVTCHS